MKLFPILGTVVSSNTTAPSPASEITYTVRYNLPGGPDGTMQVNTTSGVVPAFNRWPDEVDTIPAPALTRAFGFGIDIGGKVSLFLHVPEFPKLAPCTGSGAGTGGGDAPERPGGFNVVTGGGGGFGDHGGLGGGVGGGGVAQS